MYANAPGISGKPPGQIDPHDLALTGHPATAVCLDAERVDDAELVGMLLPASREGV
jgi:hypothetical protein